MGNGLQDPEAIRNVGVIGHPDAGVTELVHRVLSLDQTPIEVLVLDLSAGCLCWLLEDR